MLIAIDFDGTYTKDPDLWLRFVRDSRACGHYVMIVTMRHEHENEQIDRQLSGKVDRIVYTGGKSKMRHMLFLGLKPDIWIDDEPHWIFRDAG